MAERPLTGEPMALDLVNTRWPVDGVWLDEFDRPGALAEWLAEHELSSGADIDRYREPLITARAAIRQALDEGSAEGVNRVLAHGRLQLGLAEGAVTEHVELDDAAWRPAWLVTRAFLDLLATAPADRLRRCDGPACVLWFLDTSRNGRRRWCSMTACGNRAKVKAHYDRTVKP